ncbi:MAG TPA: FAD-dependent oxidoreductase [Candidatus Limnocylindrales bacterium]|nr:FAD-dependent oxidoreductase [Candidatus Limnocylindrales bacterium]
MSPRFRLRTADLPPKTADVVVVGAGVVGCATAFYATAAGLRTVVLDARPRPATLTTAAASGAFRLQFDNPEEMALVREGLELYESFAERAGLPGYDLGIERNGYLFCALDDETAARQRALVERQRAFGLDDVELLDGAEARRRYPFLSAGVRQARFRAADGFFDQVRLAWGYALAACGGKGVERRAAGREGRRATATFCFGQRVTDLLVRGGRAVGVATHDGSVHAPAVVLATGPFLARTAALAGVTLDLRPVRRQKVVMPDVPEVPPDAPMTIDDGSAAHWRPAFGGAFLLWTDPDAEASEPSWGVQPALDFPFRVLDPASPVSVARLVPFWADVWERGQRWFLQAGQYEYTPDHRPLIGPLRSLGPDGIWLNGGYSGHGVMASAGGARRLVDLVVGADVATSPFAPDRPMAERAHDVL